MATATIPSAKHADAPINQKLSPQDKLDLHRQMVRIRAFEQLSLQHYQGNKMSGFLHLYIGQESVAVGTISLLGKNDHVITAYRDHGHALAVGMSLGWIDPLRRGVMAQCDDRRVTGRTGYAARGGIQPVVLTFRTDSARCADGPSGSATWTHGCCGRCSGSTSRC